MSTTHYFWDPIEDNVVAEYDEAGNEKVRYTHEPGLHGSLISQEHEGVAAYHHFDGQGSALALTDSSGEVTDEYAYSAFGDLTASNGTSVNTRLFGGEQGYETDSNCSTHSVRNRTYEPTVARWRSPDPLGVDVDENVYRYVRNSPTKHTDPSGLGPLLEAIKQQTEDAIQISISGPRTGAAPGCCELVPGSLMVAGIGAEDGYSIFFDGFPAIGRKVEISFKVRPGADPKQCSVVQWRNGYIASHAEGYLSVTANVTQFDMRDIAASSAGYWSVDSKDGNPIWGTAPVIAGDTATIDDTPQTPFSDHPIVIDLDFRTCVYNADEFFPTRPPLVLLTAALSPVFNKKDLPRDVVIGVIQTPAIECVDWQVKLFTSNDVGPAYGETGPSWAQIPSRHSSVYRRFLRP